MTEHTMVHICESYGLNFATVTLSQLAAKIGNNPRHELNMVYRFITHGGGRFNG